MRTNCYPVHTCAYRVQGPRLEAAGDELGIVSAIAAPAALNITFNGDGGHAGAQLMTLRRAERLRPHVCREARGLNSEGGLLNAQCCLLRSVCAIQRLAVRGRSSHNA